MTETGNGKTPYFFNVAVRLAAAVLVPAAAAAAAASVPTAGAADAVVTSGPPIRAAQTNAVVEAVNVTLVAGFICESLLNRERAAFAVASDESDGTKKNVWGFAR
ncbi:MAG: hypothetical protein WAT65_04275 [Candidatus Nanopelagicales bacterium]